MSFIGNINRQEQEKRRATGWSQAVRQLCWFIRQYLRKAPAGSNLFARADMVRVEGALLDRIIIFLGEETVTVTPLAVNDQEALERGRCVELRSSKGSVCKLVWNGDAPEIENWQIARADRRSVPSEIKLDHLTVVFDSEPQELEQLSEETLDRALDRLFDLADLVKPLHPATIQASGQMRRLDGPLSVFSRRQLGYAGMLDRRAGTDARKTTSI